MSQEREQRKVARADIANTLKDGLRSNDALRVAGLEGLLSFRTKKAKLREREIQRMDDNQAVTRVRILNEKQEANLDLIRGLKMELSRAKAQPPKVGKDVWSVHGRVYDRDAAPVVKATIALHRLDGQNIEGVKETTTDANGAYRLSYKANPKDLVDLDAKGTGAKEAQGNKERSKPGGKDARTETKTREELTVFVRASVNNDPALCADSLPVVPRQGVCHYRDILLSVDLLAHCRPAREKDRRTTRYLGNSASRELHDLDNEKPGCRIDKIRFDHCVNFKAVKVATHAGYDFCAFCFGRDKSKR
jgi:hypothetical protein